jgi:hypothetical protein
MTKKIPIPIITQAEVDAYLKQQNSFGGFLRGVLRAITEVFVDTARSTPDVLNMVGDTIDFSLEVKREFMDKQKCSCPEKQKK